MPVIVPELQVSIVIISAPTLPARSYGNFGDLEQLLESIVKAIENT